MTENEIFDAMIDNAWEEHDELLAYRELGTVEELKRVVAFIGDENYSIVDELKLLNQYREIGTVAEVKALKEKAEPKRADIFGDGYADGHLVYDTYECPNCGKQYELEYDEYEYCPNCGQHMKIEWSD